MAKFHPGWTIIPGQNHGAVGDKERIQYQREVWILYKKELEELHDSKFEIPEDWKPKP